MVSLHGNTILIRNNTKTAETNIRNASFEIIFHLTFRILLHTFSEVTVNTEYLPNSPSHHVNAVGRCETCAGAGFLIYNTSSVSSRFSSLECSFLTAHADRWSRGTKIKTNFLGRSFFFTLVPEVFLEPRESRETVKTSREAASWLSRGSRRTSGSMQLRFV